ncbi:hypothetical protein AALG83_09135 [Christensenellaceae bacterium 44-20]
MDMPKGAPVRRPAGEGRRLKKHPFSGWPAGNARYRRIPIAGAS